MIRGSTMESVYEKRPWLKIYPDHVPHDLDLTNETALGDFKKSAALNPDAPAIYYFDHEISFKQVDRFSDQLAAAFEDLGLQKGDRIILDLQNVPQFPIAAYAAWKLGAIVVPVNPMYKEKELKYFCEDSGARLFLTLDEIASDLDLSFFENTSVERLITTSPLDFMPPGADPPVLLKNARKIAGPGALDMLEMIETFQGESPDNPGITPEDVAYLTYTSGTTAPPQGRHEYSR